MSKIYVSLAGLSVASLILAGCAGKKETAATVDTISVQAIRLDSTGNHADGKIIYNGTLQANKAIDLSFQVSGTINAINVKTGDHVKKGQLLATVDQTTYQSQYDAQLAQVRLAGENYQRIKAVYDKGSVAEIKMLEAKSNYEQALASSKATYQNIAHTRLFAPQTGYIGEKKAEAGSTASPGQPVLQLLDTRSIDVLVAVPESEINRYHIGDAATVKVDALDNQPLQGRVSEVGVLALNNSANYNLKVRLGNDGERLRPGMLCKVVFDHKQTAAKEAGNSEVIVPVQAVQVDENGNNYVYIISADNKAQRKPVKTGTLYNNGLSITSGLSGNERLILSGYQKLADQTPVTVKNTAEL
ncbi:efflux RND transporter periplasmic adaptor subunit [Mucilaginibacter sp. RS28]|uniref:Efflux RND transporter periplasmic adaptor subunit n=1 Tax=Mucilaginibacter straminoryzae TaxID=2932774 RepID=A0A9X2BBK7_9SPHI|nr:efflux RND transporter periplasmic adaptor subunit [Mucilaginibacter straminoryzae]MCJ8208383.1 efflux RND transporter periplasmic adaptor subunit [Mucilaginibacter straminoryzae]